MYHEITYEQIKRQRRRRIAICIIVALVCVAVTYTIFVAQTWVERQEAYTLRESVLNTARYCCAVEGSYPSTIQHLEDNYGLIINHTDYVINYEWLGDNVAPNVVVTPR